MVRCRILLRESVASGRGRCVVAGVVLVALRREGRGREWWVGMFILVARQGGRIILEIWSRV
jgi:hypothetical protein